jgi:GTP-binding protein HflX
LPDQQTILLTDTVGFIHKLPPTVVAAFRATLEELSEADLLLHVVDITHKNAAEQCQTVEDILAELGLDEKPRLTLLNKIDLLDGGDVLMEHLDQRFPISADAQGMIAISASKGIGLERLLQEISDSLVMSRA